VAGSEWAERVAGPVKSCRSLGRPGLRASRRWPASGRLIVAGLASRQGLRLCRQKRVENASATEESAKAVPLQYHLKYSSASVILIFDEKPILAEAFYTI